MSTLARLCFCWIYSVGAGRDGHVRRIIDEAESVPALGARLPDAFHVLPRVDGGELFLFRRRGVDREEFVRETRGLPRMARGRRRSSNRLENNARRAGGLLGGERRRIFSVRRAEVDADGSGVAAASGTAERSPQDTRNTLPARASAAIKANVMPRDIPQTGADDLMAVFPVLEVARTPAPIASASSTRAGTPAWRGAAPRRRSGRSVLRRSPSRYPPRHCRSGVHRR